MENLAFKALNGDNEAEIVQVSRLFERTFGKTYPLTPVYSKRYWKSHAGSRFVSLVAVSGFRAVAHIALRPDRDNRSHIQIYLAAIDPEYQSVQDEIARGFRALLEDLAQRQRWSMIYCHLIGHLPELYNFTNAVLNAREVAIWPDCLPLNGLLPNSERQHVLLSQRIFAAPASSLNESGVLFVPESHQEMVAHLYGRLGLSFTFSSSSGSKKAACRKSNGALSADCRAIETHSYRRSGAVLHHVEPSLAAPYGDTVKALGQLSSSAQYVSVNMHDSSAPAFCAALEKIGFAFCGVLPLQKNRHGILYYNTRGQEFDPKRLCVTDSVIGLYLQNRYSTILSNALRPLGEVKSAASRP